MKYIILITILLLSISKSISQTKDTLYICFDKRHPKMKKVDFSEMMNNDKSIDSLNKSITYKIQEQEKSSNLIYDNFFEFTHFNQSEKANKLFNVKPPVILQKDTSFLKTIKPLTIEFFLNTDYLKVCKTFEEEDSHNQNVIIFMIDKDEINNGKLILREVTFSRPLKI